MCRRGRNRPKDDPRRLDTFMGRVRLGSMLTDKDINRIIAVVATKQDVRELGDRIDKLEDTQKRILSALDRLAPRSKNLILSMPR